MKVTTKLFFILTLFQTAFFSTQLFAFNEEITIVFSGDDYQKSKENGENFSAKYSSVSNELQEQWPSDYQNPTADSSFELNPYIIGGNNASRNEYSEYVLLLVVGDDGNFYSICGGTLIAANKVLTAAHCSQFAVSRYYVIPNFYSFNDNFDADSFFKVSGIDNHPNYDDSSFDYDISVLTLSRSSSTTIASVHAGSNEFVDIISTVIGTGRTRTDPAEYSDILQEVDVPIVTNEICNDQWSSTLGIEPITPQMMCAGYSTDGRGGCFGDSGGPLLADVGGQRAVVGTVSFGYSICENSRQSAVYARVGAMSDFIAAQSPNTNFIFSDKVISLAPVINLLLDDSPPPEPIAPIDPAALYPPIATPISGKYVLRLDNPPGPYEGEEGQYIYTPDIFPESEIYIGLFDDSTLEIEISNFADVDIENIWLLIWSMQVEPGEVLRVGTFSNATRYPFNTGNGLAFSGIGGGCNQINGRFRIFEIEYAGSEVTKLAADFVQYCDSSSAPLRGSIRYDSSKP